MSGDITVAGTGTLTWREGNKIVAFGHPMTGIGPSAWGMAPAEIITTIPSYQKPYKLSNVGPVVGTIVQDRASAIAGVVGAMPPMASYEIERVEAGVPLSTLRGKFVLASTTAPGLVAAALAGAETEGNEAGRTLTLRAEGELTFQGLPPLKIEGFYSGRDGEVSDSLAALAAPIQLLYQQDWAKPVAVALHVRLTRTPELHVWTIEDARLDARHYEPGGLVSLSVGLRSRYGAREERKISLRLPESLRPGGEPLAVRVVDADTLNDSLLRKAAATLDSTSGLIDLLNRRCARNRLYVEIVGEEPGRIVGNREMPALPPSVLSVLDRPAGKGNADPVPIREQVWQETSVEMPGVVIGEHTLPFDIRP